MRHPVDLVALFQAAPAERKMTVAVDLLTVLNQAGHSCLIGDDPMLYKDLAASHGREMLAYDVSHRGGSISFIAKIGVLFPPPPDTMLAVYREDLGLFSARVGRAVRSTKSEALERAWAHAVDHLAFPWPAIFNGQEFRLVWYEMVLDLDQLNPRELTKLH
jgi:hypothetical protein